MRDNQHGQEKQYADIILATIFRFMFIVLAENNIKQASERCCSSIRESFFTVAMSKTDNSVFQLVAFHQGHQTVYPLNVSIKLCHKSRLCISLPCLQSANGAKENDSNDHLLLCVHSFSLYCMRTGLNSTALAWSLVGIIMPTGWHVGETEENQVFVCMNVVWLQRQKEMHIFTFACSYHTM